MFIYLHRSVDAGGFAVSTFTDSECIPDLLNCIVKSCLHFSKRQPRVQILMASVSQGPGYFRPLRFFSMSSGSAFPGLELSNGTRTPFLLMPRWTIGYEIPWGYTWGPGGSRMNYISSDVFAHIGVADLDCSPSLNGGEIILLLSTLLGMFYCQSGFPSSRSPSLPSLDGVLTPPEET